MTYSIPVEGELGLAEVLLSKTGSMAVGMAQCQVGLVALEKPPGGEDEPLAEALSG